MWIKLPVTIRGKHFSINLLYVLFWAGFGLLRYFKNESSDYGWPQGFALGLVLLLVILITAGTSRVEDQSADQTTDSPDPTPPEDQ